MKKIASISLLFSLLILNGCTTNSNGEDLSGESEASALVNSSTAIQENESENSSTLSEKKTVTTLNTPADIVKDGVPMYTLEVTKVIDTTESAISDLINDTNYLDFYSDGQAVQAVEITIKMTNLSDETLSLPFLDGVKVTDVDGISSVGGWKNVNGSKTRFGSYEIDSSGKVIPGKYDIEPNEIKLATSTVLLATHGDSIQFDFESTLYDDMIRFELPVQ